MLFGNEPLGKRPDRMSGEDKGARSPDRAWRHREMPPCRTATVGDFAARAPRIAAGLSRRLLRVRGIA